ncbi:hypothetical protein KJ359_010684 [Pestalotiopsis sp. 9143b]|nr:hypothetical protein KJ359_010684 [Pestalotiopsis sp. 9143b]
MATLSELKRALREVSTPRPSLSKGQYNAALEQSMQVARWTPDESLILQLSRLLAPLLNSRTSISVLDLWPGPKSILAELPDHLRRKISFYTAVELNDTYFEQLSDWLARPETTECPLPRLKPGNLVQQTTPATGNMLECREFLPTNEFDKVFDVVLFSDSTHGMGPRQAFARMALNMLPIKPASGLVVVIREQGTLQLGDLVCHRTVLLPRGVLRAPDNDQALDSFASLVAHCDSSETDANRDVRDQWRVICRTLGHREYRHPDHLVFTVPQVISSFSRHGDSMHTRKAEVPLMNVDRAIKNREARLHDNAAVFRPTDVGQLQQCVEWALKHKTGITILGGGHSGHCVWPHIIGVDMSAFNQIHIVNTSDDTSTSDLIVVAQAGCTAGDIMRKTLAAGLTVPLGGRPSVGAGLWLQGGIGHQSRQHGLACDAIAGAVVVSVASGQVMYVGHVPQEFRPAGAVRPDNEDDLLWSIKGAGTNVGVVVSVTLRAFAATKYRVANWTVNSLLPAERVDVVDTVGLFDSEMSIHDMHGKNSGGKTSTFKRCAFLEGIGAPRMANILISAIESRPSPLCYIHLVQGGGAIGDVAPRSTAFGCRDWDYACVIAGVWARGQDDTAAARSAKEWVYDVAQQLLGSSSGFYGADLGPDPRDVVLAEQAFGPNLPRLARLKSIFDPHDIFAYACPLPRAPMEPKLITLVTGQTGSGKDYCASVWASAFEESFHGDLNVVTVSISDATKRAYAATTGADLNRLLRDRDYKEQHRPALTAFFKKQVRQRPGLPEETFMNAVDDAAPADVLLITGMRDDAPATNLSHLVPHNRLVDVRVEANDENRLGRGANVGGNAADEGETGHTRMLGSTPLEYSPSLTFNNDAPGEEAAECFAKRFLIPLLHEDLHLLANMVRSVPGYPRPGIEFRHILGIAEQKGGLSLCTSLLETHYSGDWTKIDRIVCCEAGGFVFASALAARVDVPLLLIREAEKLPPPTLSAAKSLSNISSSSPPGEPAAKRVEMDRDAVGPGISVVIVDDVFATGKTLSAIIHLLIGSGVHVTDISVLVVAGFPAHRGRELLRQAGFGGVNIQTLLIFGGL